MRRGMLPTKPENSILGVKMTNEWKEISLPVPPFVASRHVSVVYSTEYTSGDVSQVEADIQRHCGDS